jgi:hypothetical protein
VRDEGLGALLHKVGIQISNAKVGKAEEGSIFFQLKNVERKLLKRTQLKSINKKIMQVYQSIFSYLFFQSM